MMRTVLNLPFVHPLLHRTAPLPPSRSQKPLPLRISSDPKSTELVSCTSRATRKTTIGLLLSTALLPTTTRDRTKYESPAMQMLWTPLTPTQDRALRELPSTR